MNIILHKFLGGDIILYIYINFFHYEMWNITTAYCGIGEMRTERQVKAGSSVNSLETMSKRYGGHFCAHVHAVNVIFLQMKRMYFHDNFIATKDSRYHIAFLLFILLLLFSVCVCVCVCFVCYLFCFLVCSS